MSRHTDTDRLERICNIILQLLPERSEEPTISLATFNGLKRMAAAALEASREDRATLETSPSLDDRAKAAFEKQSANWSSVTPWDELAEETRQHWRDFVARAEVNTSAADDRCPVIDAPCVVVNGECTHCRRPASDAYTSADLSVAGWQKNPSSL